jgi:6-pyruvoyltetrahydropterin/6-carboxytetrahydropterin synthase
MGQVRKMKKDKKLSVTKVFTMDCAHRLRDYDGKCANLHGHTYRLEITVTGPVDDRGMIVDFGDLKTLVDRLVISRIDHRCLNDIMEANPTAENMCRVIWDILEEPVEEWGCILRRIVLWETPTSCCTLEGED